MKKKNIIVLIFIFTFILSACKKEEHYESKNLPIKSVFDDLSSEDIQNKDENLEKDNQDIDDNKQSTKENGTGEDNSEKEKGDNNDKNNINNVDRENENNEVETIVTQNTINIRSTPEFGDNVVKQIETGKELKILEKNIGEDNDWAKIEYEDQVYYVNMEVIN